MDLKDQHWIPKSYSKEWADPSGPKNGGKRVHLYDSDGKYTGWAYPPNVFSSPDLYTTRTVAGRRNLATEKALSRIESDFARAKRKLMSRRDLNGREKGHVAAFTAAMRNRLPKTEDHFRGQWQHIVELGEQMEQSIKRASPLEKRKMAMASKLSLSPKGQSISLGDARRISQMPFGESLPRRILVEAPILAKLNLSVLHSKHSPGFITSDNPVVWWVGDKDGRNVRFPFGLGHPLIEVTLPISPKCCLYLTRFDIPLHIDVGADQTVQINMRTLAFCDKLFIANSDQVVVDWIEK